jgi:pimeloyl-ACP methyl ester carboxylesterase
MPYINAKDGSRLCYEDTGGRGPAVIFSHGLLMDRQMFAPQVEALRATCRCITWDQRGFGLTGPASGPFTYWTSAEDVLAIMSSLDIEQASLAGLSQGGFLSMRAALLAPERVSSLILMATRSGLDAPETIENFRGLRAEWSNNGSKNVQAGLADVLLGPGVEAAPWTAKWASIGRGDMNDPLDALMQRDDITPRLAELKCPALVIHGNADIAIDVEHGRQLARDLPGSGTLREIDGAGHAVNLAQPVRVTEEISIFLDSLV